MNDDGSMNNQEICDEMEPEAGMDEYEDDSGYENNIEEDDDFRPRGRGRGFRGGRGAPRNWGSGGMPGPREGPPRFRGRGYGPGGPPFRGRGPPPPLFGRGGPPPRNGPNFPNFGPPGMGPPGSIGPPGMMGPPMGPPNWGPPGMGGPPPHMMERHPGPGPNFGSGNAGGGTGGSGGNQGGNNNAGGNAGGPPPINPMDMNGEIWVETKTSEGKSYYYNARTRETTWTKPEGPNIKVISQDQVEAMAQAVQGGNMPQQQQQQPPSQQQQQQSQQMQRHEHGMEEQDDQSMGGPGAPGTGPAVNPGAQQPPGQGGPQMHGPPPGLMQGPPPGLMQGPPPNVGPFGPGPGPAQFGMPPPGWMPPWGMPALMPPQQQQQPNMPPMVGGGMPGVPPMMYDDSMLLAHVDPDIVQRSSDWTEHRAPDGRSYYYNAKKGESVWERPQPLKDLDAAKMQVAQNMASGRMPKDTGTHGLGDMANKDPSGANANADGRPGDGSLSITGPDATSDADKKKIDDAKKDDDDHSAHRPPGTEPSPQQQQSQTPTPQQSQQQQPPPQQQQQQQQQQPQQPRVQDKSRPISSTPVPGTPWCVVWTGDGRVFFYNPSSRTSVWERPEDLVGRADVDKMLATPPEALVQQQQAQQQQQQQQSSGTTGKGNTTSTPSTPAATTTSTQNQTAGTTGTAAGAKRTDSDSSDSDESTPAKKAKKDETATPTTGSSNGLMKGGKIDIGKEAAIEAEVRAAKERAVVPLETRVKSFREMLAEKEVSAFSTWEKELHKIVFDPRYLLLTSKERKQVFEKYVKERAEDERREKRNRLRERKEAFRRLLGEAHLHGKSSFSDFAQKYAKDERFKNVEKMREREGLFNEYLIEVRKREKEEKSHRREQAKRDFHALLREHPEIDRHSRWSDVKKKIDNDPRYRAVDSSGTREDWFREYCKILKDEKRRAKEKEREHKRENKEKHGKSSKRDKDKDASRSSRSRQRGTSTASVGGSGGGGVDGNNDDTAAAATASSSSSTTTTTAANTSSNSKHHHNNSSSNNNSTNNTSGNDDSVAVSGPEDQGDDKANEESTPAKRRREENGNDGTNHNDSRSGSVDDERAREEKEKEKQARTEASLREREKEVQRTLATHLRDRDKEREQHKRDEAIQHFNALLADLVRNADLTWREAKRQIRKDHRWELAELLSREDKERLYAEHVDQLLRRKRDKFRELLDETADVSLTSNWKDVRRLIKEDPRYTKFASSERCEREFRDYIKDKLVAAKTDFKELLQETKLITHKSLTQLRENENHMQEIEEILRNDKRYLVLDHIPNERTQLIITYLEELDKRGPPPPPTASEPSRRPVK